MTASFKNRLTGLLKYFTHRRAQRGEESTHVPANDQTTPDIGLRLREIRGEEKMRLQLLYERWAVKDAWHLRTEALPLLLGIDPEKYQRNDPGQEQVLQTFWRHATQCIDQGLLPIVNPASKAEDWQAQPLAIYQWAVISRLAVPEPLVALMDFIARSVKRPPQPSAQAGVPDGGQISVAFDADREKVLGMALAVLAAVPGKCRDTAGTVSAELLVRQCKEQFHTQAQQLNLADGAMIDLIHKWLMVSGDQ